MKKIFMSFAIVFMVVLFTGCEPGPTGRITIDNVTYLVVGGLDNRPSMSQRNGGCDCLCVSYGYLQAITSQTGTYSDKIDDCSCSGKEESFNVNRGKGHSLSSIKTQLNKNKPVVVQGECSGQTTSHFFLIVGYRDGSEANKNSDFLILDSWNGEYYNLDETVPYYHTCKWQLIGDIRTYSTGTTD